MTDRNAPKYATGLTNARLSKVQVLLPDSRETKAKHFNQFVNLFFTYRKIEWAHHASGTYGIDDWRTPLEA